MAYNITKSKVFLFANGEFINGGFTNGGFTNGRFSSDRLKNIGVLINPRNFKEQ